MNTLDELLRNNREWAERTRHEDPGILPAPVAVAGAEIPVDRLLRLARARQPDHGPGARRGFRPPQHRQCHGPYRPQLHVGDPVRRGRAEDRAHPGSRPLRLRRRECGAAGCAHRPGRQLDPPRRRRRPEACGAAGKLRPCAAQRSPVRTQRDRAGGERVPVHGRAGCLGTRAEAVGARLGLQPAGWLRARAGHGRGIRRRTHPAYDKALAGLLRDREPLP